MRSLFENKRLIILFSILTLVVLVLLSRGLHDIPFRDGMSFARAANGIRAIPIRIVDSITRIPVGAALGMWGILIFTVILIGFLMNPEWRKRLLRIIIRVGLTYWALYIVFTRYRDMLLEMGIDLASLGTDLNASTAEGQALPPFASSQTIDIATYILSFGVALLLIFTLWKGIVFWKELQSPAAHPLKKIAQIARSSIDELTAGRESTDVIMKCYYRMSDAVSEKRGLDRNASMTPGEFAAHLEKAGLPAVAVHRLTRLFEGVRYGGYRSSPGDVREAVASLTAILDYCGESA